MLHLLLILLIPTFLFLVVWAIGNLVHSGKRGSHPLRRKLARKLFRHPRS